MICPYCHQSVLPTYYFCPNCGTKLGTENLPTSTQAEVLLFAHSIILPSLLFLTISKWKGLKYYRSEDPKKKEIGTAAILILVSSTLITYWFSYVLVQRAVQSFTEQQLSAINADFSATGN